MARSGILYSDVSRAAAALVDAGKNPTVDTVREAMGATGSKSTIAPLLKQWKSAHQGEVVAAGTGLPSELLESVKDLHQRLQADATLQVEKARTEHRSTMEAITLRLREAEAREAALTKSADKLVSELKQTTAALTHQQAEHHAAQVAAATVRAAHAALEQRLADRAAEVRNLSVQLAQTRTQFTHYQEATAAQRSQERQSYDARIARLEQELKSAQQHLLAQQSTLGQQETRLAQQQAEAVRNAEVLQTAQAALAAAQANELQLKRQLDEAVAAAIADVQALGEAQQQSVDSRIALAVQEKQTENMGEQLAHSEKERERMHSELLRLVGDNAVLRERIATAEVRAAVPDKAPKTPAVSAGTVQK